MSLINKVLRDLDARHADAGLKGGMTDIRIPASLRSVEETSRLPKVSFSIAVLIAVTAAAGWWWSAQPEESGKEVKPDFPKTMENSNQAPSLPPVSQQTPPQPSPVREGLDSPPPAGGGLDSPSFAGGRPDSPSPQRGEVRRGEGRPKAATPASKNDLKLAHSMSADTAAKLTQALPSPVVGETIAAIEKTTVMLSPHERAEGEYRKGYALMQQGRAAEAATRFQAALSADITHVSARNGLLLILMESKRTTEAEEILQAGLAHQPVHLPWVVSLARLYVEQSNATGAWALLQTHMKAGGASADFQGISGVVLQKLGRMKEAGGHYQAAARLAPSNPNWWIGLGLAMESEGRIDAAKEAFQTARDLPGGLPPGLAEFVNQRLK